MKRFRLLKIKCSINLRKFFLNIMLNTVHPTNKIIVFISQNLDKHIVAYQKEIFF